MAKKEKKQKEDNGEKKGGTILAVIGVVLIVILWVAIFAILIKLDVGGLGTMLRPNLKDIPVINKVLPEVSDEQKQWENDYPYTTMDEAIAYIKELEAQIAALNESNSSNTGTLAEKDAEIARLKVFEDDVLNFEKRVEEFDNKVVFNSKAPDISEYKAFYEQIDPSNAERIYELVLQKLSYDDSITDQANILKTMKPGKAAEVMEESTADIELLAKWLLVMKTDESAAIIDKMTPLFAAKIFRKMEDMNQERLQAITDGMDSFQ